MASDSMFGSPLGIRKFAKEQPREKVVERVFPPSPTLAQLNDLSMSGFDPMRDLPAIIATAREVEQPQVAAPPAAEPSTAPALRVVRQLNIPAAMVRVPESVRLWEEYNRTENPADFVRADEQMMRERATAKDGGETTASRRRKTIAEQMPLEQPQADGEGFQRMLAYLKQYPIRQGEAQARAYEPSMRDVIGGAIAGEDPNTYAGMIRGRAADALAGSRGLEGSGTLGFGALDALPRVGAALQVGDAAKALTEGDYASAAVMGAIPAAIAGRGQIANAAKRAMELARQYAPQAGGAAAVGATMMPQDAQAGPVNRALNFIRAYHGSPYKFDKFDISKIGTGEGAQTFGHGLYFAENEGVARGYRDALTMKGAGQGFVDVDPHVSQKTIRKDLASRYGDGNFKITKDGELHVKKDFGWAFEGYMPKPGHMYEVGIHADPQRMLDWDKPVKNAPALLEQIAARYGGQEALLRRSREMDEMAAEVLRGNDQKLQDQWMAMRREPQTRMGDLLERIHKPDNSFGYSPSNSVRGRDLYDALSGVTREDASRELQQAGVPGIKYLDQGSRGTGEGTSNYVVFDPNIIEIMRRYDKGGAVKRAIKLAREYVDPPTKKIEDWKWRPLPDVQKDLGLTEIPPHVQQFGDYMREVSDKAGREGLSADDLIRAFTTTRASIQRQAVDADKVRAAGLPIKVEGNIRPEGAWAEWLMTPMGRRYVGEAAKGNIDADAVAQAIRIMAPFGKHETDVPEMMSWAAKNLPGREQAASDLVARSAQMASSPNEWRDFTRDFRGIGPSKSGFVASLMGRGDLPTLDAREIILHTGAPTKGTGKFIARGKGLGGEEAVDRLAARQAEMALETPEQYKPFYQHLAHHAVWDKAGNDMTTHDDVMRAMRSGFDQGGAPENEPGLVDRALAFLSQLNPIGSAEAAPVKALVRGASRAVKEAAPETMRGTNLVAKDPHAATAILSNRDPAGAVDFGQGINNAEYTFTRKGDLQPWKEFDPYQAVKERGIIAGILGDKSAAGSIVHDINGVKLTEPVNRVGGGEFQRSLEGPEVWASRPSAVKNMYTRINKGMKGMGAPADTPVFASHVVMGTPSIDSTQMMAKAILRQIEPTRGQIDPKAAETFDAAIRKAYPDWPGILSPVDAERFLATKEVGKRTSKILQQLDKAGAQEGGLPNLGTARFAMMEPRLVSAGQGATGFALSRLDPNRVTNAAAHDVYPVGMLGPTRSSEDYVGGTRYQIPLNIMFPDWWKTVKPTYLDKKSGLRKATTPTMIQQSVLTQVPLQRANQEWLDNLMKYTEENPKKWGYRLGGAVKRKTKKSAKITKAA